MDSITSTNTHTSNHKQPWYRRLNQMKPLLLGLTSMAQMLDIINVASVTIILPDIMEQVGFKVDQLQWVASAYALAFGALLLIGGRLGDLFGHRRIYILGVTWFSIWATVNGFAKDPIVMSIGRALQGMGAGFTVPNAVALLTTTYPVGPERTHALAVFGGCGAVGSVIGVLLGGILGSTIGWRWIFYFTAIIGFAMAVLSYFAIPTVENTSTIPDRRVDYFGSITFMLGIVGVIYYLSEGPANGWSAVSTLVPFCIGLVLLVVFLVIEYKIDYPIMPFHIWRSRRFVSSCSAIVCNSAAANAVVFFSSLTFQNVQGYSSLKASLAFIVYGVGCMVTVLTLTKLVTMVRTKVIMIVGWLCFMASGIVFAQIKSDSSYWSIAFPALILNFLGVASTWLCCQVNSVADADDEDQGVVAAVYNVSVQVGAPIGIAISNIVANHRNSPEAQGADLLPGYVDAFYSCAAMAGVGLIVTVLFAANQDKTPDASAVDGKAESTSVTDKDIEQPGDMETIHSGHSDKTKDIHEV